MPPRKQLSRIQLTGQFSLQKFYPWNAGFNKATLGIYTKLIKLQYLHK